ncbi:MAG: Hsp70 family protein [Pirellulaceae bacterium]
MATDPLLDELPSRYVVGIDLGTTNSAVCYVDTSEKPWRVRVLSLPQLVAPGQVESRDTLPSFHYQPAAEEIAAGGTKMPWRSTAATRERGRLEAYPTYTVGFYARDFGGQVSGRMVSSAKSWLCHSGVNRTSDILPWHAAADVEKLSPVEASSRYLGHIRDAWDFQHPKEPLESQDIVLTLPASFDEVARELTVEAAAKAGLPRVVLIEEPQAAFYAWIYKHAENWEQLVSPGQKILVCDIGGGTTDFTLIRVRRGEGGKVQFHRVAVGDHLILGGDNFDLALAQHVEQKLTSGGKLEPRQWDLLVRASRQTKEELLGDNGREQATITLPGSGSKLIGSSLSVPLTREEVRGVLVDGFMPWVALDDKPAPRRSGFQEFGLPYASDPAITKFLAAFLSAHRHVAMEEEEAKSAHDPARPDVLLFNGGVFESRLLKERLIDSLNEWFATPDKPWQPLVLVNDRLDLAVARGAAYYGMVRRGEGVRIAAGLARTYYLGLDATDASGTSQAICLVPGNAEPGQDITLPNRHFDLLVSEPAEFPLYVSSTRLADRPGELFSIDSEQMTALPPIRTALKTRRRSELGTVPVELHARLTEIGTLDLWCSEVEGVGKSFRRHELGVMGESKAAKTPPDPFVPRTWRLQFDVRSTTQTDVEAHESAAEAEGFIDESAWQACQSVLEATFGKDPTQSPEALINRLTIAIGMERNDWPTSLLRRIWESLLELEPGRRKSSIHEARWLNLLGYALRPGYGLAVDDWRVAETWRTVQGKLAHAAPTSRTESLILWRRIAGGCSSGQQRAIAEPLLSAVRTLHKKQMTGKGSDPTFSPHEGLEVLRLLGSLELLSGETKIELGNLLIDLLPKRKLEQLRPALAWGLGRIGARVPVYGPLNTIVAPREAGLWAERILDACESDATTLFALVQIARRTHDRYRDLPESLRDRVLAWLDRATAPPHAMELVRSGGQLDEQEQSRVFGESLPKGLRIR